MTPKTRWIQWPFSPAATLGLATFFLLFSLLWLGLWRMDPMIFRENGPIENFQAGFLFLGLILLVLAGWRSKRRTQRILYLGLALLYLTMLVRELDFRSSSMPWLHYWLHGHVRNIWVGSCWVLAFVYFLRSARAAWQEFIVWLRQPPGALLLLAGGAWLLGGVFDHFKPLSHKEANFMVEELLEINAAASMLASATLAVRTKATSHSESVNQ